MIISYSGNLGKLTLAISENSEGFGMRLDTQGKALINSTIDIFIAFIILFGIGYPLINDFLSEAHISGSLRVLISASIPTASFISMVFGLIKK